MTTLTIGMLAAAVQHWAESADAAREDEMATLAYDAADKLRRAADLYDVDGFDDRP